jgi:hypothetical protein
MEIDLLCADSRPIVEVDGAQHLADPVAYRRDRRKDQLLQENGYLVLRYLAEDLAQELDSVLDGILRWLSARRKPGPMAIRSPLCEEAASEPCPIAYRRLGQRWRPWNTAMISRRSPRARYGMTYRVPGTPSSRVPDTRPGRPRFDNSAKRSTAASNVVAVRAAAPRFSRAI